MLDACWILLSSMHPRQVPEILRVNLTSVVLTLKAMGISHVLNFDFMEAPGPASTCSGRWPM